MQHYGNRALLGDDYFRMAIIGGDVDHLFARGCAKLASSFGFVVCTTDKPGVDLGVVEAASEREGSNLIVFGFGEPRTDDPAPSKIRSMGANGLMCRITHCSSSEQATRVDAELVKRAHSVLFMSCGDRESSVLAQCRRAGIPVASYRTYSPENLEDDERVTEPQEAFLFMAAACRRWQALREVHTLVEPKTVQLV
jgi:hypothetical protein